MIEDYDDAFKKIIINATRNALIGLGLNWRFDVYRYSRPEDSDQLWRIDFFDFDRNSKRFKGWIPFEDPYWSADETWCTAEITRLIQELINKN